MAKYPVCFEDEVAPGEKKIVEIAGRSIGVFNLNNEFFAVRNRCPHKGAPLCKGLTKGFVVGDKPYEYEIQRTGEILKCPWHGWEFDLKTGRSVFNPHRLRVKSYQVSVEAETPFYEFAPDWNDAEEDPSLETFAVTVEGEAQKRRVVFVTVED
ncbi:MAG: Rieske (2Fe-2S) protein [Thermomicrobiales bacterium]|nr:Rieske (2Fe-2S) protein [Thermomicrobiales bacterium]